MPANNKPTGLPELSYPSKRSHSLLPLRRRHQPHQPRLLRRPQRNRLPHPLRPPRLLRALHRLHPLQASPRRTITRVPLVARTRGNGHQRHRLGVFDTVLHFLLFPVGHAGAGRDDELEYCDVWRHLFVGYGLLRDQREEGVYSAGEDC